MHSLRTTCRRPLAAMGTLLALGTLLGGCVDRRVEKETTTTPAASPTTVVVSPQRTVTYPEGRWQLYGDGKSTPYYWVWVPAGATPPTLPPPPRTP